MLQSNWTKKSGQKPGILAPRSGAEERLELDHRLANSSGAVAFDRLWMNSLTAKYTGTSSQDVGTWVVRYPADCVSPLGVPISESARGRSRRGSMELRGAIPLN